MLSASTQNLDMLRFEGATTDNLWVYWAELNDTWVAICAGNRGTRHFDMNAACELDNTKTLSQIEVRRGTVGGVTGRRVIDLGCRNVDMLASNL